MGQEGRGKPGPWSRTVSSTLGPEQLTEISTTLPAGRRPQGVGQQVVQQLPDPVGVDPGPDLVAGAQHDVDVASLAVADHAVTACAASARNSTSRSCGPVPSTRARMSNCSASRTRRVVSSRATVIVSRSSFAVRAGRSANSSSPARIASGVRSSWPASARKDCSAFRADCWAAQQVVQGDGEPGQLITARAAR